MKITAFGEIMLRLSPDGKNRLMQIPYLRTFFGGSEANTLLALSGLGIKTDFVTKLPFNEIADACVRELNGYRVGTQYIRRGGDRMGIYFCEPGTGIRAGQVIYDRKNSSFATSVHDDYDWNEIFDGTDWFHFTGITPALSDSLAEIIRTALQKAKDKGITVSCDLNYRSMLWSKDKANAVMSELMPYVDILMANEGSVFDVFDMKGDTDEALASSVSEKFGFKAVALTQRESMNADENILGGLLFMDGKAFQSQTIRVNITDRVGGGDCFNAGLIYGLLKKENPMQIISFANAANAYKHTVEGDYCSLRFEDIQAIADGNLTARIKR